MTTSVDLSNRALALVGSRSVITALDNTTPEGLQCSLIYSSLLDWMLGITNWNFARKVAVLSSLKVKTSAVTWTAATDPAPPWQYEYGYPSDCIRLRYVTSSTAQRNNLFIGEPVKFALGTSMTTAGLPVVNASINGALGIYTYRNVTIDNWPQLFTQAFVTTMASFLAIPVSGDKDLQARLQELSKLHIDLAVLANLHDGLYPEDTTVEWIQARGIPYPTRRGPLSAVKGAPNG